MAAPTAPPPPKTVLRVAAISGSLRRASANTGLIHAAAEICRESIPGLQIDHVDISELPLLNTDLEVDGGFPPAVEAFRDKVRQAGCFLFASPEYNYSISGPLKNALDWGSRPPNCWADRTAAMLSAPICRESIPGLQIDPLDILELPLLNTDLEVDGGYPPAVEAFRDKVRRADCFLFASPEYNYSISGPLKNALDWGSRPPNCWADRAAAMLSASGSTGDSRSQYHIRQVGVFLDIHFINKPEVFTKAHMPPKKFDADGNLIDSETKEQVRKKLLSLQAFALRLQGKSEQGN